MVRLKMLFFSLGIPLMIGLAALHLRLRLQILNPKNFDWLWQGDWANAASGFLFFVQDSWRFPLGKMENILQPFGSSIGFTDSIPMMAFVFKFLSPLFDFPFHYLGLYFLLCFCLQSLFAFLISKELGLGRLQSYVMAIVFALAPPLLYRIGHISLCSHFLLLGQIYLFLRFQKQGAIRYWLCSVGLVLFATGVHPYLWAMSFVLGLALELEFVMSHRWRLRSLCLAGAAMIVRVVVSLAGLFLVGYFLPSDKDHGGFSFYRGDLTVFFNPMGERALMPRISASPGQYEAYSYLGIGSILLLAIVLLKKDYRKQLLEFIYAKRALFILGFFMWVYSLSNEIAFAGKTLVDIAPIYKLLGPIPNTFRSSGRFSWPLFYLLLLAIWSLGTQIKWKKASWPLHAILLLQIFDLKTYFSNVPPRVNFPFTQLQEIYDKELSQFKWKQLKVLPQGGLGHCSIVPGPSHDQKKSLVYFSALNKLSTNMGDVSRFPKKALEELCLRDVEDFKNSKYEKDVLYLVYKNSFDSKQSQTPQCAWGNDEFSFCALNPN